MSKSSTPQEKMFFFSAIFGMANRIMNLEYDPELAFLHHVTLAAYSTINTNLAVMAQGQTVITLPPNVFDKLQDTLNNLAKYIEEGKQTYPVLEVISNLAYSTSGNGYYLFLKGVLTI
jgi:transaldolase